MAQLAESRTVGGYKILDYLLKGSFEGTINSLSDLPTSPPQREHIFM